MDQRDDQTLAGRTRGLGLLSEAVDHPCAALLPPLPAPLICCRRSSPLQPAPPCSDNSSQLSLTPLNSSKPAAPSFSSLCFPLSPASLRNIGSVFTCYLREVRMDALCARFVRLHLFRRLGLALSIRITLGGFTAVLCVPRPISHHFPYLLPASLCFPRQPYVRVFSEYRHPSLSRTLTSPVFIWTRP